MTDIEKSLIIEVAKEDYKKLVEKIENLSYEEAFKALNGFNLSSELCKIKGGLFDIIEFFDFNFGSLNGTIFRTKCNKCELYDKFDFWIDDFSSPIARLVITDTIDVFSLTD